MALEEILGRVHSMLMANVNQLLERAADPVQMSGEFLRQAGQELSSLRHEASLLIAAFEETKNAYNANEEDIVAWAQKAEMALKADREDLARQALAEKSRRQSENRALEAVLGEQKKQVDALKEAAESLQRKIAEMEHGRNVLVAQHRTAIARRHVQQIAANLHDGKALAGFDRLQKRTQSRMNQAAVPVAADEPSLEDELSVLESGDVPGDASIDDELSALKARLGLATPAARVTPKLTSSTATFQPTPEWSDEQK